MYSKKICLASDNWGPSHPLVMQAVIDTNEGSVPSYGSDPWTEKAEKTIQETFKNQCKVFIVPTGTGANILALRLSCRRHESINGRGSYFRKDGSLRGFVELQKKNASNCNSVK